MNSYVINYSIIVRFRWGGLVESQKYLSNESFFFWNSLHITTAFLIQLLILHQDIYLFYCFKKFDICSSTSFYFASHGAAILYCFTWSRNFILLHMEQKFYYEHLSFSSDVFNYQFDFSLFWLLNLLPSTS